MNFRIALHFLTFTRKNSEKKKPNEVKGLCSRPIIKVKAYRMFVTPLPAWVSIKKKKKTVDVADL